MNTTQLINISPQTISLNQMISLVTEIEAEVYASPMFSNALDSLTNHPKKEKNTAAILKKLTRSVIRVAFQRFMSRSQFSEPSFDFSSQPVSRDLAKAATENTPSDSSSHASDRTERHFQQPKKEPTTEPATNRSEVASPNKVDRFVNQIKDFGSKIAGCIDLFNLDRSHAEPALNPIEVQKKQQQSRDDRANRLKVIGGKLRDARLSKSITIAQVHLKTAILASQIEALETGSIDKLPEDVYLQGYIRRIGHAVGLDGDALAKELLQTASCLSPEQKDISSTYKTGRNQDKSAKYYLTSTHLFFGYLTLISGAIGMLSSITNPADSQIYTPSNESEPPEPPACKDQDDFAPEPTPGLNSLDEGINAQISISPPEVF